MVLTFAVKGLPWLGFWCLINIDNIPFSFTLSCIQLLNYSLLSIVFRSWQTQMERNLAVVECIYKPSWDLSVEIGRLTLAQVSCYHRHVLWCILLRFSPSGGNWMERELWMDSVNHLSSCFISWPHQIVTDCSPSMKRFLAKNARLFASSI